MSCLFRSVHGRNTPYLHCPYPPHPRPLPFPLSAIPRACSAIRDLEYGGSKNVGAIYESAFSASVKTGPGRWNAVKTLTQSAPSYQSPVIICPAKPARVQVTTPGGSQVCLGMYRYSKVLYWLAWMPPHRECPA